jgi:SAM-dependent methyltransferase
MSDINLADLYQHRFNQSELPRKNKIWRIICKNFLQKFINNADTVVEVACGYGEFINNIAANRKIAIDLNPDTKKLLNSDVDFHLIPATELEKLGAATADIVFTSNFLEHLPNKSTLETLLVKIKTVLKPEGKFIILGPNLRYLAGKYWDFYDHHLGLTHLSLCEILKLKGYTIQLCIDRFLPYTTQTALPTHPFFVQLYLKFPLIWRIIGKQFFIIAQKSSY